MRQSASNVAGSATVARVTSLQHVEAFIRVAELGSFTRAGRQLGLPKSSVSRAVARLERDLGVQLLQRSTRKLALTAAGHRYLDNARGALQLLVQASSDLRETEAEPSGLVRLTAPPDPSGAMVADALATFAVRYPRIQVELLITGDRLDLVAEGIDLAVRAGKVDSSALSGRRVGRSSMVLVASPGYLARRGAPRKLADLADHDCVLFRAVRNRQRWTSPGEDARESVEVTGKVSTNDLSALLALVRRGLGIGRVPQTAALDGLDEGALVQVLRGTQWTGDALYVMHPVQRPLPRRVKLLRDHLFTHLLATTRGLSPSEIHST